MIEFVGTWTGLVGRSIVASPGAAQRGSDKRGAQTCASALCPAGGGPGGPTRFLLPEAFPATTTSLQLAVSSFL